MKSKKTLVTLAVLGCLLMASQAFGFSVVSAPDNSFSLTGLCTEFTSWAIAGGATTDNGFSTFQTGEGWFSGSSTGDSWRSLYVPFSFSAPLATARVDFSATCFKYGSNWGLANLYVRAGDTTTQIFSMNADRTEPNYNYTASQTPGEDAGAWMGYTDFSALVSGQTSCDLIFEVSTGWSGYLYNGGQFFPSFVSAPNFVLTGSTVPEPGSLLTLGMGAIGMIGFATRRRK